ncbi:MAG: insulinase family protein [Holosporaceae bacterium]|jgi:predicted Zn-dependent peptidase|nr:insulinase family protein [Holosporaceae bacterium]
MSQKLKIIISVILVIVVSTPVLFKKEERFIAISEVKNNHGVKAYQIRVNSDNILHIKCKFRNTGVLHNTYEKYGISAVIGDLLCRKINGLSSEDTKEKLLELGVKNLSVNARDDDIVLSFYVLKDKAPETLHFLSSVFFKPEFSKNDLEFVETKYPEILDLDSSHPKKLLMDKLMAMLYQNHNYGLNNSGTAQAIASITEDDVHDFIKSNFSKDRLEVFFTGNMSQSEIETYLEKLISKLPEKNQKKFLSEINLLSSSLSEKKETVIHKKDMGNIVGIMFGVRVDNLSEQEKAAAHIIIKTLFDRKIGDFSVGLRLRNISYGINCHILHRRFSSVFCFWNYVDKEDLASYNQYLKEKISLYAKRLNIKKLEQVKENLMAQSRTNFTNLSDMDQKIKYNSLPFSEITPEILMKVAGKLFNEPKIRIVYILQ